jgi:hypothetical protein
MHVMQSVAYPRSRTCACQDDADQKDVSTLDCREEECILQGVDPKVSGSRRAGLQRRQTNVSSSSALDHLVSKASHTSPDPDTIKVSSTSFTIIDCARLNLCGISTSAISGHQWRLVHRLPTTHSHNGMAFRGLDVPDMRSKYGCVCYRVFTCVLV